MAIASSIDTTCGGIVGEEHCLYRAGGSIGIGQWLEKSICYTGGESIARVSTVIQGEVLVREYWEKSICYTGGDGRDGQ